MSFGRYPDGHGEHCHSFLQRVPLLLTTIAHWLDWFEENPALAKGKQRGLCDH
jgi:hypothetical protein